MGIGLLTFSAGNGKSQAKESLGKSTVNEASDKTDSKSLTPTVAPSPTPLPVYNIEVDAYPDINKLFTSFYKAKNNHDVNAIKKLLSDPTKVDSKNELKKKTEYIESYKNIKNYTKKGFTEGTYIVYVYHEIKFTGIKTAAPGLSKFYLITGSDGKLKIFSGEMDEKTKAYYNERNEDKDVASLIEMTEKRSKKAIAKDKDLKSFWKRIDKLASKSSTKA
jgi:hypothetical protein